MLGSFISQRLGVEVVVLWDWTWQELLETATSSLQARLRKDMNLILSQTIKVLNLGA